LASGLALAVPAHSSAAVITVGSPLSVPATLNTVDNLDYQGTNTAVPPTPQNPTGIVHTTHFGADTVLWNKSLAHGSGAMPASGQALKVRLEGCAQPAPGGPPPLTQIHLQSLAPVPDGGARVSLSSQAFDIPVCGQRGASGSTITTYAPTNLCVNKGDYVGLNEEGGFEEPFYRAGVPYRVLGAVKGSIFDSFIRHNGTGNGSLLSALDTTAMDGFAANANEELMLQVQLGTGRDARYVCPGGTRDAPKVLPPLHVRPQTDGVNHQGIVQVAIYCRPAGGCQGNATLTLPGHPPTTVGSATFDLPGNHTSHLPIHISSLLMSRIHANGSAKTTFTALMGGRTFAQTITIKVF
jgi:hypothetical protein